MDDRQCMCLRGRWGRRCMIRAMQRQQLCRACRRGGPVCQCGCYNCDDADDEAVAPHMGHAQGMAITSAPTTPITTHLAAVPGVTKVYRSRLAGEVQHLLRTKMLVAVMIFLECMKQALGAGDGECNSGSIDKTVVDESSWLPWAVLIALGVMLFAAGWKLRGYVDNLMTRLYPLEAAAIVEVPRPAVVQAETSSSSAAAPTNPVTRNMATQSQTTYQRHWAQPRFAVVGELMHGAYEL